MNNPTQQLTVGKRQRINPDGYDLSYSTKGVSGLPATSGGGGSPLKDGSRPGRGRSTFFSPARATYNNSRGYAPESTATNRRCSRSASLSLVRRPCFLSSTFCHPFHGRVSCGDLTTKRHVPRSRTMAAQGFSAGSPLFSPRGEAKCVRGPSVQGARRSARGGVLEQYVEHGEQAQRSNGGPIACFDRQVVRNAG